MNNEHDCPQCQTNDREQDAARKAPRDAGVDKTLAEVLPLADGIRLLADRVWIPCCERMPPAWNGTGPKHDVLTWNAGWRCARTDYRVESGDGDGGTFWWHGHMEAGRPTHWMPLPAGLTP